GEDTAVKKKNHGGAPDGEGTAPCVPFCPHPPWLPRRRGGPLVHKIFAPPVGGRLQRRGGVAPLSLVRQREGVVAPSATPRVVSAAARARRQRLNVDGDRGDCILGNCGAVREYDGYRLADITNLVIRHNWLLEWLQFRQRMEPHRNDRHRVADIRPRDDGM